MIDFFFQLFNMLEDLFIYTSLGNAVINMDRQDSKSLVGFFLMQHK